MSLLNTSAAGQTATSVTWSAVVTRADGTVEDLGVIAYGHKNPFRTWAWKVSQWLRGTPAGRTTGV